MGKKQRTIDERIELAEAEVVKYKSMYEEALQNLKELVDEKRENNYTDVLKAVKESGKSYKEIIKLLKESF